MKVLKINEALKFSVIPRTYPVANDTLILTLRNEMTNATLTPAFTFTITDLLNITITTLPNDFKDKNKYEIELKKGDKTLYLGKLITLNSGSNVQNYNYGNDKFKFRD